MIRELDLKKKQADSDFIKSLSGVPGKELAIQKRLDKLSDIKDLGQRNNNNNNNNNDDNNNGNLFPPKGGGGYFPPGPGRDLFPPRPEIGLAPLPLPPRIDQPPPPFISDEYELQNRFNTLRGTSFPPPFFANFHIPAQPSSFNQRSDGPGPGNNLFGSEAATLTREKVREVDTVTETKVDINDTLHELPQNYELELGDGQIENLGVTAGDLLDAENITKQEEGDVVLEQIKDEYGFEDIKEAFDEVYVPDSVYFFYGGESENFTRAVDFLRLNSDNREFAAFLLPDLCRQFMTSNRLCIHAETGDIFYENHSTRENFYNFLIAQQNEQAANITKNFSDRNSFEAYISQFLQAFSMDNVKKYDLFAHKNAKYLFYRFNDYIKGYGSHRRKIKHTSKMKDSVAMQKVEEKSKQFLVEKIIHGVEFNNPYNITAEKKSEIIETVESNYRVARRVYQHFWVGIYELCAEFIRSVPHLDLHDMDEDIKSND